MKNENKKINNLQKHSSTRHVLEVVVLKIDKISSLKITYKKDVQMISFASAFRAVARMKILVG